MKIKNQERKIEKLEKDKRIEIEKESKERRVNTKMPAVTYSFFLRQLFPQSPASTESHQGASSRPGPARDR